MCPSCPLCSVRSTLSWMKQVSIADLRFNLIAIECAGASELDAIDRLAAWLDWQHEHAAALEALQRAERDYHRTIAGSAFANPPESPGPLELHKESLEAV